MDCNELLLKRALAHLKVATTTLAKAKKRNPRKRKNYSSFMGNPSKRRKRKKNSRNALAFLNAGAGIPNPKRRKRNSSSMENPRVHYPKTARGRRPTMARWTITSPGKPPIRFTGTKADAHFKAVKLVSSGKRKKLVLDGPK